MSLLIEAECLSEMGKLEDGIVDLIICDLPYGMTQNKYDEVIPFDGLWAQWKRLLKDGGNVVLTGQGLFTARMMLSNPEWFKYKLVWEKSKATNFLNAKKQPLRKHEDICVFSKGRGVYNPQMWEGESYNKGIRKDQLTGSYGDFSPVEVKSEGLRYPVDVIYFKTAESEGKVWHPNQKPVELGRYLIKTYSNEGGMVLDCCFGSGSFLVAAAMEKRDFIGIELNDNLKEDMIDVAHERIKKVGIDSAIIRRKNVDSY